MSIQQSLTGAVSSAETAAAAVPIGTIVLPKVRSAISKGILVPKDDSRAVVPAGPRSPVLPSDNSIMGQIGGFKTDITNKKQVLENTAKKVNYKDAEWSSIINVPGSYKLEKAVSISAEDLGGNDEPKSK